MGKPVAKLKVAKLKVLCARSMHEVVTALTYDFSNETGHEVALGFATVGAIERLDKHGALLAGSRRNIATTRVGVAIRERAPAPDITTPAAFKQTLINARRIAFSEPQRET